MATLIPNLAAGITTGEGYGVNPSNRPTRDNNPGDLTGSGYAGQVGTDPQGFAIFSSPAAGAAALQQYLSSNLNAVGSGSGPYGSLTPSSTLQDFLNIYAGNPDPGYISAVAQTAGVAPSTPLGELQAFFSSGGVPTSTPAPVWPQSAAASAPTGTGMNVLLPSSLLSDVGAGMGIGISPSVVVAAAAGLLITLYVALR